MNQQHHMAPELGEEYVLPMKTILTAAIGTSLEWFDFTIYVFVAPYLAKLFFPADNHLVQLIATFGIFAAGYLMRPIGGIFFGNLGDKIGRKKVLMISVLLMSVPMLVTAVLPTYYQIGVLAVIILLITRMVQGFSIGGEYTGVLVMLLEQSDVKHRGYVTSWGTFVSGSGVLLSSVTIFILTSVLTDQQMLNWGWRVPFFLGFLIAAFSLVMQANMVESPHFERLKREKKVDHTPVIEALKKRPGDILTVLLLTGYLGIAYYLVAAFLPSYLVSVVKLPHDTAMLVTSVIAATYAFTAPLWGWLSDRIGRKPILIWSTVLLAILAYPMFWLLVHGNLTLIFIAELALVIPVSACTAAFVSAINELFPTRQRYSGVSTGYNVGNAIFGGTAPLVATSLIHWTGDKLSPSFYLMISAILILFVMARMKETSGKPLAQE